MNYLKNQLNCFFPDNQPVEENQLRESVIFAESKLAYSFDFIKLKYYAGGFKKSFNYLYSDHYSMLLYWISRHAYTEKNNENIASKVFLLNKLLFGIDVYYKINLPDVFLFVHPLGTVLGNAQYSNFFVVYQGCTVGSKQGEYIYPTIGENVTMYSNSSIIGKSNIGDNVIMGANSSVISKDISSNTVVLNHHPNQILRPHNGTSDIFKLDNSMPSI